MAMEHLGRFQELEGQTIKRRGQSQNWTMQYGLHSVLSERRLCSYGHVIRMDHQRIPLQALHWECRGLREVQVVRVQTGGAQSTRTC